MIKKSVGMRLRDGRESKQFGLDDLESVTGIKSSYLLSMEMDQFSLLPSKSYEISYIKKYAEAVDLDHEELLRDYHIAVAEKQERLAAQIVSNDEETKKDTASYSRSDGGQKWTSHRQIKTSSTRKNFFFPMVSMLVLIILVSLMFFVFWKHDDLNVNQEESQTFQQRSTSRESSTSPSSELPILEVTPSVDGINLTAHLSKARKPIDIVFSLSDGAQEIWFSVSNSNYESGATLSQEVPTTRVVLSETTNGTLITLGNTSGIKITVNGQELDLSSLLANTVGYITLTIE
ncbi:helix-turn-helix domain-containing protein [Streptococcus pluranimalium]|uniref:helix-turn-helix domain-containing protein n=1 Tax=Streptococcus pluranimalium TaxID=82348 RepID=UPI0039FD075E